MLNAPFSFYHQLGLVADEERTVPQVILVLPDGERMLLGGYAALSISGIESLFRPLPRQKLPEPQYEWR